MFAHIPYGERFLDWHLKAALIILTLNELYTIYIQHSAYSVELNANVSESWDCNFVFTKFACYKWNNGEIHASEAHTLTIEIGCALPTLN